jgi:hypothetical protein
MTMPPDLMVELLLPMLWLENAIGHLSPPVVDHHHPHFLPARGAPVRAGWR